MSEIQISQVQGMTSLQIAEATGKRHDSILRDIRNLLEKGVCAHNFVETSTRVALPNGGYRESPMYQLTPKGCLILASGYDPVLREKIIDKLEELQAAQKESELTMPAPKSVVFGGPVADVRASLEWMQGLKDIMGLGRQAVAQMVQSEGKRLGLPIPQMPPTAGKDALAVTSIIKKWRLVGLKAQDFNQAMMREGGIAVRNGRKVLTGWGLDYGENRHSEKHPDVVWPVYYEDCFTYLCDRLNIVLSYRDNNLPY